jgi:hypothetical protein
VEGYMKETKQPVTIKVEREVYFIDLDKSIEPMMMD